MTESQALQKLMASTEQMRIAQKAYFKSRSKEVLIASKIAEKEVDNIIFNFKQLFPKQNG